MDAVRKSLLRSTMAYIQSILFSLLAPQSTRDTDQVVATYTSVVSSAGSIKTVIVKTTARLNSSASRRASATRPSRIAGLQTSLYLSDITADPNYPAEATQTPAPTSPPTNNAQEAAADAQQTNTIKYVALIALALVLIIVALYGLHRHRKRRLKSTRQRRGHRALRRDVELSRWRTLFWQRPREELGREDELPKYDGKLPNYPVMTQIRAVEDAVIIGEDSSNQPRRSQSPASELSTNVASLERRSTTADTHSTSQGSSEGSSNSDSYEMYTDSSSNSIRTTNSHRASNVSLEAITRTRTNNAASLHTDTDFSSINS